MICADCGAKPAQEGHSTCFRCRVLGVGFSFRGGAVVGRNGFHTTKQDWLREHLSVDSEKQLLKDKPNVERYTS